MHFSIMRTSGISNVQGRGQAQLSKMELTISVVYFSTRGQFFEAQAAKIPASLGQVFVEWAATLQVIEYIIY